VKIRRASLFGIVILVGAAASALLGTGIATFAWEEGLPHQNVGAISIPELEPVSGDATGFQLVVKEPEVKLECRPELMSEREQSLPNFEVILVNELPDPHAPELVTFFGCPLADSRSNRAVETY
jgi:hypothetical protein